MFYAHYVLSKKGPFSRIWLAAHWDKKLTRAHVFETNINSSVEAILEPKLKMALRTSGHLLLGVVRIYSRKAKYLLADCNEIYVKIKTSFRPGVVDQPDDANREAALAAINLPENIQDYEATMAALNVINLNTMNINQSRPEDITMREDFGDVNLGRIDDDFGEGAFEELPSREMFRGGEPSYDSVYGRGAEASGRFSVRDSDRPSIRPDMDADDTLIGDKEKSAKAASGLTPAPDANLDYDFVAPLYADDDSDFGGDLDPSIFNNPALLEEAATTLAEGMNLPSEPITTGGALRDGEVMDVDPLNSTLAPKNNGADAQVQNQTQIPPATASSASAAGGRGDSGAFALMPIDMPTTVVEPRRAAKRKRRLIIDEQKSIPSDLMKTQMQDTSEIVTTLDLAPPTKRLMHMKETGGLEKLLTLPGRSIPSRVLQRMFTRNLRSQQPQQQQQPNASLAALRENESASAAAAAANTQRPQLFFRPPVAGANSSMIEDQLLSAAATPRDLLSGSGYQQQQQQHGAAAGGTAGALGLDAIPEESLSTGQATYPGYTPSGASTDHQHPQHHNQHDSLNTADNTLASMHDPFLGLPSRPTDLPDHADHGHHDDDDDDDDNAFPLDTQYLTPHSVLSEASQHVLFQHNLQHERSANQFDGDETMGGDEDDDDEGRREGDGAATAAATEETEEFEEERRLERRSKDMLRRLRSHIAHHGWGEQGISLLKMCEGNNKKQAASKFYTMLLLRKQGSVRLFQEAPFTDIRVCRGPNFIGPATTAAAEPV